MKQARKTPTKSLLRLWMASEPTKRLKAVLQKLSGGLQWHFKIGCRAGFRQLPFFANETQIGHAVLANQSEPPEIKDGQSRVLLAPYGKWDHRGGMQVFERQDAEALVNEFNSLINLPSRMLGLPWYIGHPDHPRFSEKYRDTRAYGRVKKLEAGNDGLWANVKWNRKGLELIEGEEFHGHSVNWRVRKEDHAWRPISLKSVGFTNEPNIPVPPVLANEEETENPAGDPGQTKGEKQMKEQLIKLLGLANEASDEDIQKAVQGLVEAKRNTETTVANEKKAKEETEQKLTGEREANTKALQEKDTAFANERKARVTLMVDGAVRQGKVLPAQKEQWVTNLCNEFDSKLAEFEKLQVQIKTDSKTGDLGNRKVESSPDRIAKVQELVNERMTSKGEDYDTAFQNIKRDNPALFEEMKQPAKA